MATPHLLLIADLRHASPRWPSLGGALLRDGWDVSAVTAPLGPDPISLYGFPEIFAKQAHLIEVGPAEDVLQPLRRTLWRLGLRRGQSLTGQLQELVSRPTGRSVVTHIVPIIEGLFGWPDVYHRWARPAADAACRVLATQRCDVLVSSSPYPSAHVAAARVKQIIPSVRWVADFRDLWVDNHSGAAVWWRRPIDRILEKRVLRDADAFMTPTDNWADLLRHRYNRPASCVPNGFVDYERIDPPSPGPRNESTYTLLYTGIRYAQHQRVDLLCDALATLKRQGAISAHNFRLLVHGPYDADWARTARLANVEDLVHQGHSIARQDAKRAQSQADALLFFQWDDSTTNWISSLKLHEYVGSGRPILATGGNPRSEVSTLLRESGRAGLCVTASQVAEWLLARVEEWRRGETMPVPVDWEDRARRLSGITRGLLQLKQALLKIDN